VTFGLGVDPSDLDADERSTMHRGHERPGTESGVEPVRSIGPTRREPRHRTKHCYDRVGAFLLIVLLLPVLVAIAVAIRIDDGGPVLMRQTRVGRHGREFRMFTFRSMAVDAEQRVTRLGVLLRRYSLDELPQLLNVLGGAMAIVGPRPPLPAEAAAYGLDARRLLLVKPGLTGLWQINGGSDPSRDESVPLDLRYVENWTPTLDVLILRRTLRAVFSRRDAYWPDDAEDDRPSP
jgi:lipopolysaccharide/colanic/teichoic acid biosynthesis glycosyltransferase